jgi:hypothetical protein
VRGERVPDEQDIEYVFTEPDEVALAVAAMFFCDALARRAPRPFRVGFNIKVPEPYPRRYPLNQLRLPANPYMRAYTSVTNNKTTLAALHAAGWRLLVSAPDQRQPVGFAYAIDNGAWSAHINKKPFDFGAFEASVDALGTGADWVVAPDIVAGGLTSLRLSEAWVPRLLGRVERVLIAVQDGMSPDDVRPMLEARPKDLGIFLGGSTEWKVANIPVWAVLAEEVGCYYHVGRVNTVKRIRMCRYARAHSFDGTSPVKFPKSLPLLDNARKEPLPCLPL